MAVLLIPPYTATQLDLTNLVVRLPTSELKNMKHGDIDNATHLLNMISLLNSRDQYCLWVHKIVGIKRITATAYWRGDGMQSW
jgi:hypothetical protein